MIAILSALRSIDIQDTLLLVGAACLIYGAGLIYRPAGFITAGAIFLAAVYAIERSKNVVSKPPARRGKPEERDS
jgi:hypothetical protein